MDNATSDFNATPQSARLHITIYGRRNVGKSSLINALTGQQVSLVADMPGTTTDPVRRAFELHPLGPCLFIDTAGYDDEGVMGNLRNERTRNELAHTDIALMVTDGDILPADKAWMQELQRREIPVVIALNKTDTLVNPEDTSAHIERQLGLAPIAVSTLGGHGIDELRRALTNVAPQTEDNHSLTGSIVSRGDIVVLVMPQDKQAPKGRLILPQVQTIRDLLDHGCTPVCCTPDNMEATLKALHTPPALIITDSQAFQVAHRLCPTGTRLTSFSILMAAAKGDIKALIQGAHALDQLTPQSHVLIAEACAHAPLTEDIGREKIPALLRKRVGQSLRIDVVAGRNFPGNLSPYDIVIHCGACMFNRRYMLSRIALAQEQGIPITNYGLAIAHLRGIPLDELW